MKLWLCWFARVLILLRTFIISTTTHFPYIKAIVITYFKRFILQKIFLMDSRIVVQATRDEKDQFFILFFGKFDLQRWYSKIVQYIANHWEMIYSFWINCKNMAYDMHCTFSAFIPHKSRASQGQCRKCEQYFS